MDVSENSDTPKSSILIGFSIINHPFWGTPIFGNTHMLFNNPQQKKNTSRATRTGGHLNNNRCVPAHSSDPGEFRKNQREKTQGDHAISSNYKTITKTRKYLDVPLEVRING